MNNKTEEIETNQAIVQVKKLLDDFKIPYDEVSEAFSGPTIFTIAIKPTKLTKVDDVLNLYNDFAMALNKYPIAIEVPIPGIDYIGIQIPKENKDLVRLQTELESKEFKPEIGTLLMPLGRNTRNESVYNDLFQEPHMLFGGATCSGKSNYINSIIVSAMKQYSPERLRFILADPKRIELTPYNNTPYLVAPVILDYQKAYKTTMWCVKEIDRRFGELIKTQAGNIKEYNKIQNKIMPYILFIVDEVSDFSVADKSGLLLDGINKILQMGSAVGVHMILASARPCEQTFPSKIRMNFPSRIAFATASDNDSKIILDKSGAYRLLGKGDALYFNQNYMDNPIRVQTPFISEEEIEDVIGHVRKKYGDSNLGDVVIF
jgi:S-DNA-T family DNA segregation ATPase FtsK/SpoIIIE